MPFYISTEFLKIKVLGTAFDVKTDLANKKIETTLVRGKVALLDQDRNEVMTLSPGEKVTYTHANHRYISEKVDVNLCATWRLNQSVFENATLREIANLLSAKYNVNINIESSELARRKFRCVFNKDESLQDILKLLGYLAPLRYRIEGAEVFIWESTTKK